MSKSNELQQLLSLASRLQFIEKNDDSKSTKKAYSDADIELLTKRFNAFSEKYNFEKSQIVKWKSGLKNRRFPFENQPAIVVDILNPPLIHEADAGTPYFREPLDILLGFIDEKDGDFVVFHFDSRRFEPYETK